jgi:glycosyltransferase involved in cell wall biosynthesis
MPHYIKLNHEEETKVKPPQLSVVVPVYNERDVLELFYKKLKEELEILGLDYEILFVNDGSTDGTGGLLDTLRSRDDSIRIIDLKKRMGQLRALKIGLDEAKGEILITMDADLQNDPGDIKRFIDEIRKGKEAVGGVRGFRKDPFCRRMVSRLANFIVNCLSKEKVSDLGCAFNALRRETYKRISEYYNGEFLVTKPLFARFCKNFCEIEVRHYPRYAGKSKYNLRSLFFLFLLNLLTAVSFLPKLQIYAMKKLSRR